MQKRAILFVLIFAAELIFSQAIQSQSSDTIKVDYEKIFSYCLDGNIKPALAIVTSYNPQYLSERDLKFKAQFENRFKNTTDESDFLETRKSSITELLKIYRDYWRMSLLDNSKSSDTILMVNVTNYLIANYTPAHDLTRNEDSHDVYVKNYIQSVGLHTTGFGKTGKYYDLLVWKNERDTTYSFYLNKEVINSRVVMMDNFITLGWEEYATLGRAYPGGWSTKEALFCVEKSYDLNSEQFLISYLAHKGRHFSDFISFPKLTSADLEYRAKLTELSMAQNTLFDIIKFFINNANYNSENGHEVANYCVIRDLSKILFKVDFEKDINEWKKLSTSKINDAAYQVLITNTKALEKRGNEVEKHIKG